MSFDLVGQRHLFRLFSVFRNPKRKRGDRHNLSPRLRFGLILGRNGRCPIGSTVRILKRYQYEGEKGVRYPKCKAPCGPFRFLVPDPVFQTGKTTPDYFCTAASSCHRWALARMPLWKSSTWKCSLGLCRSSVFRPQPSSNVSIPKIC